MRRWGGACIAVVVGTLVVSGCGDDAPDCDFSESVQSESASVGTSVKVTLTTSGGGSSPRWDDLDLFGELWGSTGANPTDRGPVTGAATYESSDRVRVVLEDGAEVVFSPVGCA